MCLDEIIGFKPNIHLLIEAFHWLLGGLMSFLNTFGIKQKCSYLLYTLQKTA